MVELLGVSRSATTTGATEQLGRPGRGRRGREELKSAVLAAHQASDGVNGAPRITADLRAAGQAVNRKTVANVMAELQIQGVSGGILIELVDEGLARFQASARDGDVGAHPAESTGGLGTEP
ncbi:transposase [Nocardioides immobilis]|uniref:Transposase n=1 Tax=Nocardioides immobilis TaxID=2049295 RepID=A0A417Y0K1_9ACTN|nr:IS3 family transposase [Nocardioides immobilis]RHW26178.1 transposase [Nocardioides immobilis]